MGGKLIICGTPIGNLGDASPRLAAALDEADVVYCEDTRRTRKLLDALGVQATLRSYFVGNEAERTDELGGRLADGATVALVTDAGMPAVSDPGHSAVTAALAAGAEITVIPGPSAVVAALAVSGLPSERFVFEGFLPRKGGKRRRAARELSDERRTIVLFAAASRLAADLAELVGALGETRRVVIARELTKLHEEVWRGTLGEAAVTWGERTVKGEVTLVVEGAPEAGVSLEDAVVEVERLIDEGVPLSDAVSSVAAASGVRRRRLYETALARRRGDDPGAGLRP